MVTRIRRGVRPHLYIKEHREAQGLSLEQMAGRMNVERNTIWRWEKEQHRLNPDKIAEIADALGLDHWTDLARPPGIRSLDAMLAGQSSEVRDTVIDIVARLTRKAS
jgi:transcriptional regulator with XRE-family HTH domain